VTFRLVALDLDGTLLRPDGSVSARTRDVLRQVRAQGVRLVFVTARPPRSVRVLVRPLEAGGLAVCCNGALVYDLDRETVVARWPLVAAVARELVGALRAAAPGVCFAVEYDTGYACEAGYAAMAPGVIGPSGIAPATMDDALALCATPVAKLIARHPELGVEALLVLATGVVGERAQATHSGGPFVEVSAAGVDKAAALAVLCAELGVQAASVVAFGDALNDLPLLRWAGHAVAVANAHPEVRAVADEVAPSNQDDGVAVVLERLLAARTGLTGR
jgi:HAD superfamily hydrolase (TIGR01484 family)